MYSYLGRKRSKAYPFKKGRRGQNAFWKYLRNLYGKQNVVVYNNPFNLQDVDIVVQDQNGFPIRVYEVTNYSGKTYMDRPRAERYKDSLNYWKKVNPNIFRGIVVTRDYVVDKIKGVRNIFRKEGIEIIVFKETP